MSEYSDESDKIGEPNWRAWHAHLYGCTQCKTGTRCAWGERLLATANREAPIPTPPAHGPFARGTK